MVILAIETATKAGSIALLRDGKVAGERHLDPAVGSARTLAPAIEQLLAEQRVRPDQLELIAIGTGPGSFTGLRVGITTAKTLAYALGCGIVGVDTLDAIAQQVGGEAAGGNRDSQLHAAIDAQRREVFLATYEPTDGADLAPIWRRVAPTAIVPIDRWLSQLAPGTIVTGPALSRLRSQLPPTVLTAAEECWTPQAATIGRLGLLAWHSGRRDDLMKLMPTYLRPSYAEEKVQTPKSNVRHDIP